jgi:AcrR family transcriptional regulator
MGRIPGVSAAETRTRLLEAAARVFGQEGYERATVALIAREAGATTGAIYAHYSGKADLLVDALRAHGKRATAAIFSGGGPTEVGSALHVLGMRLLARDPDEGGLLIEAALGARRDPELAGVLAAALADRGALVTRVLDDAQRGGSLADDVSTAAAARFMLMLALGSMLTSNLDLPPVAPDEWDGLITRTIRPFLKEAVP